MTFWIYNVGMGVALAPPELSVERKPLALEELAKTTRLHSTDEEGHIRPVKQSLYSSNKEHVTQSDRFTSSTAEYKQTKTASRQQVVYAEQIMSSPVRTLSLGLSYQAAHAMFVKYRHRHFPVVDEKSRLVGLVSDRDMLADDASLEGTVEPLTSRRPIINIMSKQLLTASATTTIHEICQVMFNQHIGALPITDDKANLLGIITRSDILRIMILHGPIELWA